MEFGLLLLFKSSLMYLALSVSFASKLQFFDDIVAKRDKINKNQR